MVPMLQDSLAVRHYQKLTDGMVDLWNRGHRYDDLRMYMDGYLTCLRHANVVEAFQVHRLEEEAYRFLRDPSNFELTMPLPSVDYY